jgi:CCR4-NOT transcription complex subunit 3
MLRQQQQEAQLRQQQQQPSDGSTKSNASSGGGSASGLDIISGLNGMSLGVPNSGGGSSGNSTAGSVGSGGNHRRGASSGEASILSGGGGGNRTDGSLLQDSFATLPSSNEHDRTTSRSNSYAPQNPYPSTPASFPSVPNAIFENPAIFEKLGTDALFYIFYYKQGTYQQYLAARELKKQSWRFHKKYMTWFQRHEEPKVTTDDYEQGTYVYFDWETGWCTRIKQEFTFEYVHLEDTLQ